MNRLCGSGMQAVADAARLDRDRRGRPRDRRRRRADVARAVRHGQAEEAFQRGNQTIYDTTLGWRFVNPKMDGARHARDGRDRREGRGALQRVARGAGQVRADVAAARRQGARVGPDGARDHADRHGHRQEDRRGDRASPSTSIRVPRRRSSSSRNCGPRSRRMARSPPAMRRASTTAPPRCSSRASRRSRNSG